MDNRKWKAASAATPPAVEASPSTGYATDGDPGAAIAATVPGARWFHQIGEELRNVITAAGLTPSDSNLTQLQLAIQAMIDGRAGQFIVRAASTANINLAAPGAAVDGVTMAAGDRFLPKDQTDGSENGIYIWNGAAVPATRATDADNVAELKSGSIISVREGTVNADTEWTLTTDGTIVIGTTALTFARKDAGDASTTVKGQVRLATTAEAQAASSAALAVTPASLAATVLGIGQTWQSVIGSRSAGTTYTNSTGRPIAVSVGSSESANASLTLTVGGVVVDFFQTNTTNASEHSVHGIVPNNEQYLVTQSACTIVAWIELR